MYGNEEGSISEEDTRKFLTAVFKVCDVHKKPVSLSKRGCVSEMCRARHEKYLDSIAMQPACCTASFVFRLNHESTVCRPLT